MKKILHEQSYKVQNATNACDRLDFSLPISHLIHINFIAPKIGSQEN